MIRNLTALFVAFALLVVAAAPAVAGDTPRSIWIKAKCALCHGEDGSSNTPAGKQTKAPDLRTADLQKISDADLSKRVTEGHSKMPSFKSSLSHEQVFLLVAYLRSVGKQAPKK